MKIKIKKIVQEFIKTIQGTPVNSRPIGLEHFPSGACLDSSMIIESLLREHNIRNFDAVGGEHRSEEHGAPSHHAWLESDDYIIDVTIEQFDHPSDLLKRPQAIEGFYLFKKPSAFHDRYKNIQPKSKLEQDTSIEADKLIALKERISSNLKIT